MQVADLMMKKGTRLIMVGMNETVEMAIRLLRRENVGAVIVKDVVNTEGNTAVGVFSERDVLEALDKHGAAALKFPISRLMSTNIISCSPDDEIGRVFDLMVQHHIRHVPVFERGAVIGVISIRDLLALRGEMFGLPRGFEAARAGAVAQTPAHS
ncbi:MAG TPA: CBS domain-containing protein [Beijerinckiaceae bacterium]|jgi:CBS domain-containing protein